LALWSADGSHITDETTSIELDTPGEADEVALPTSSTTVLGETCDITVLIAGL
jgi:hypothetical protein